MSLEHELSVAVEAARSAGQVIRDSYAKLDESEIDEKAKNDMVTVVDVEAQRLVVERIRGAFPTDFILAEEDLSDTVNAGISPDAPRRWIIDPLDGTTNYIHAYPMFAVSIALEINGSIDVGVTYAPMLDELFTAARGEGAFLNGAPMSVSKITDNNRLLLGTGFPFRARHYLDIYLKSFAHFFNNARGLRRAGSAALDLAYVASGRLDGFWELTLSPWDIAAGVILIEEAGGKVTDFFGGKTYLDQGHIIASNTHVHDWMQEGIESIFSRDLDYSKRS